MANINFTNSTLNSLWQELVSATERICGGSLPEDSLGNKQIGIKLIHDALIDHFALTRSKTANLTPGDYMKGIAVAARYYANGNNLTNEIIAAENTLQEIVNMLKTGGAINTTTVNIAGHVLTTTSSNPILYFDSGSGQFFLQEYADGNYDEQYVCNPTNTYPAEAIPLLGAPTPTEDGIALTPGQTYYYTYYWYDGSDQFAIMVNHNGNISWPTAFAGDCSVIWNNESSLQIGDCTYSALGTFIGLSVDNDGNVDGNADIPYGNNCSLGGMNQGNAYESHRSYIYYLYDENSTTGNGGNVNTPTTTTVILMNADGTEKGRMSTNGSNPIIFCTANDSGELRISGTGDKDDWSEYVDVAISAEPPAGFSVSNDYNITSSGDFSWNAGENGIALTPGNTYTYYIYSENDITNYDSQCAYCGTGISDGAAFYPYCSEECRDADAQSCHHDTMENVSYSYSSSDGGMHNVVCNNCGQTIATQICDGSPCSVCGGN